MEKILTFNPNYEPEILDKVKNLLDKNINERQIAKELKTTRYKVYCIKSYLKNKT